MIWISDYSRGYLGMYDTKTGETKEWPSPGGPRSQPYGITVLNGIVWYDEGNTKPNGLVRFDPKTEKFQTFAVPSGGGVDPQHDADGRQERPCARRKRRQPGRHRDDPVSFSLRRGGWKPGRPVDSDSLGPLRKLRSSGPFDFPDIRQ